MACIAKRRGRYIIDFYDNQGTRRWKTMPAGTTKAKTRERLREIEEQLVRGTYAHLMTPVNNESAKRLEKGIFQPNGSKMVAEAGKGAQ